MMKADETSLREQDEEEGLGRVRAVDLLRISDEGSKSLTAQVVREVPLTILLNGREMVTLLCTPDDKLNYLAVGFLLSEGLIKKDTRIRHVGISERGWYARVDLEKELDIDQSSYTQRIIGSGCAGAVSFYRLADAQGCAPLDSALQVSRETIYELMKELQHKSTLFKDTGGVHVCALGGSGGIEIFAEDLGRHNAADKIIGECFLKGIPVEDKMLLTSGRVSSEILIKIAKEGVPIIVSRSAPTDLAVGLADRLKVTLVGFARGRQMNVYTHPYRIT